MRTDIGCGHITPEMLSERRPSPIFTVSVSHQILFHRLDYEFHLAFGPGEFLNWKEDEVTAVKIVYSRKKRNKPEKQSVERSLKIPMIYVQLIDQFCTEMDHSERNKSHEALRRGAYAVEILQHVGTELKTCSADGAGFRSRVLTPILQRYIQGIPDSYTPIVYEAISRASALAEELAKSDTEANVQDDIQDDDTQVDNQGDTQVEDQDDAPVDDQEDTQVDDQDDIQVDDQDDAQADDQDDAQVDDQDDTQAKKPTILGTTFFYLSDDPVNPENIPYLRWNLLYIPEMRWHLHILTDNCRISNAEFYEKCRVHHHDYVMEAYQDGLEDDGDNQESEESEGGARPLPPFSKAELEVIIAERLSKYLADEVSGQVSKSTAFSPFQCH